MPPPTGSHLKDARYAQGHPEEERHHDSGYEELFEFHDCSPFGDSSPTSVTLNI